jgi:hypothetical protein
MGWRAPHAANAGLATACGANLPAPGAPEAIGKNGIMRVQRVAFRTRRAFQACGGTFHSLAGWMRSHFPEGLLRVQTIPNGHMDVEDIGPARRFLMRDER